jgi:EAL domain-containing protein (putative c-di-GMP-specific phosphodiesterase class I)
VPLAETTGQILAIGKFVLESACQQLERWSKQPEASKIVLAVNVSAREFFDEGFVDRVIQSLSRFSFNPKCLELELTESQFITNFDQALVKAAALKGMGLRLSIDDFGTGYSSLSRLKKLPFDQLKIDASFVRDLVTNPSDAAIVKTIIELGKSLSVEVLAEGVETQAQMDALIALGCEKFQGYLQGKPMPISQVEAQFPSLRA